MVLLNDPSAPAVGLLALRALEHVEDEMRMVLLDDPPLPPSDSSRSAHSSMSKM
jgi:hypothetical protein